MTVEWRKGELLQMLYFSYKWFSNSGIRVSASLEDLWISFTSFKVFLLCRQALLMNLWRLENVKFKKETQHDIQQKTDNTRKIIMQFNQNPLWKHVCMYGSYNSTTVISQLELIRNMSSLEFSISLLAQSSPQQQAPFTAAFPPSASNLHYL